MVFLTQQIREAQGSTRAFSSAVRHVLARPFTQRKDTSGPKAAALMGRG